MLPPLVHRNRFGWGRPPFFIKSFICYMFLKGEITQKIIFIVGRDIVVKNNTRKRIILAGGNKSGYTCPLFWI